jgi:hypothetical protein
VCLRETWQKINDPKELVGLIFVDIVADHAPELKKARNTFYPNNILGD